jgi:agmatinase
MKFAWANSDYRNADVVLLGVPDESGSRSYRKGCSKAPDKIREVSQIREVYGIKRVALPQVCKLNKNIYDMGNIKKSELTKNVKKLLDHNKIPVVIGGDHSITASVLKAYESRYKKNQISLVYFDAHPDFVCSPTSYYGSVVCDVSAYKIIDIQKSIGVGIRAIESEEIINMQLYNFKIIYAVKIPEKGIVNIMKEIKKTIGKNIYISIDMDVIDPAFAPGVSTPVPAGLTSNEFLYILKQLTMEYNVVGFDICEVCPAYDINDSTSHLASRLIIEMISCLR